MHSLLFLAIALGLSNVLVNEGILSGVRRSLDRRLVPFDQDKQPLALRLLRKLVSCAPCASFWTGALVSLTVISPMRSLLELDSSTLVVLAACVLDGIIAHAAAVLYFRIVDRLSR